MSARDRYQKLGWDLFRELLLLRDNRGEVFARIGVSEELEAVLDSPPPFPNPEDDYRFQVLASVVLRQVDWLRVENPELVKLAGDCDKQAAQFQFEKRVCQRQEGWNCSSIVSQAFWTALELYQPSHLGSLFLLRALLYFLKSNAMMTLLDQGLGGDPLADATVRFPDFRLGPKANDFVPLAQGVAARFGHSVWGSDHLLIALLETDCDVRLLLEQEGVGMISTLDSLSTLERETQDTEWSADEAWYQGSMTPDLAELMDAQKFSVARELRHLTLHQEYENAGQALVQELNALDTEGVSLLSSVRKSTLFEAIVARVLTDKAWQSIDYDRRYWNLAREVRAYLLHNGIRADYMRHLLSAVFRAWSHLQPGPGKMSVTLSEIAESESNSSLRLLIALLNNESSLSARALKAQGVKTFGLSQALEQIENPLDEPDVVRELLGQAGRIARRRAGSSETATSTLDVLLAMLGFRGELEVKELLEKLGVKLEALQQCATELEPEA